ncbi:uncharacterized protein V6R79_024356 [Siganus canaliculatus]
MVKKRMTESYECVKKRQEDIQHEKQKRNHPDWRWKSSRVIYTKCIPLWQLAVDSASIDHCLQLALMQCPGFHSVLKASTSILRPPFKIKNNYITLHYIQQINVMDYTELGV